MKSILQSKTFWFNVIKLLGGVALAFSNSFPDSQYVGLALQIESVISILLRMQTNTGIR